MSRVISEERAHEMYDEMLNDCNGTMFGFGAADILKEMDPTAYRCGFADWVDSCPFYVEGYNDEGVSDE
jgi:hypothetical protein